MSQNEKGCGSCNTEARRPTCIGTTNSIARANDLKVRFRHAIPELVKIADAITKAGFVGVRIDRARGEIVGFNVARKKLAGWMFEGIVKAVRAGETVPPIASVLAQLNAANEAFEAGLKEYEAQRARSGGVT